LGAYTTIFVNEQSHIPELLFAVTGIVGPLFDSLPELNSLAHFEFQKSTYPAMGKDSNIETRGDWSES
jgi:hypothetical protein